MFNKFLSCSSRDLRCVLVFCPLVRLSLTPLLYHMFIYRCIHKHFGAAIRPSSVSERYPGLECTTLIDSLCAAEAVVTLTVFLTLRKGARVRSWGRDLHLPSSETKRSLLMTQFLGAEEQVTGSATKELIFQPTALLCVLLSWHAHSNVRCTAARREERVQHIAGSPTEWLEALSPICS